MSIYNSILVVADINRDEQPALARAMHLAAKSKSKSRITLFMSIYDFSYDMTSMLSSDEREAMRGGVIYQRKLWLEKISQSYLLDGIDFDIKVVWHHRPYEAIISEVFSGEYDILIKATRKHDTLESAIFTPTDWHLLRKCPCPVLLVKNAEWPQHSKILASVHVGSEEETHHALNNKIVDQLLEICRRFDSSPYLVSASPYTPANIAVEVPEFDALSYSEAIRSHYLTQMKMLRQNFGIDDENTTVEEGLPEEVIPRVANDLHASMVIIGTTGRTGLSAVFIGNTAESVIDKLTCDVLALKPNGYISPLDPNNKSS
ncbi:universal stress protein UspE [Vibrio viridaestus]|uniref:Universal stress protein UspE n=1 Tax=Vibrio viridaestus TaxID=2487322 RepID=A0A3N9TH12_9VIBR|nr:universal stress protein UspE [Vibrio viridaestus]RQW63577.1 universal stress protein UspE [Vibrio viridaestus]